LIEDSYAEKNLSSHKVQTKQKPSENNINFKD
jgi:hypothetical protein